MKKICLVAFSCACPILARSQDGGGIVLPGGNIIPDVVIRTIIVILLFYVVTSFLLRLVRMLLNHRLKSKMIGMGIVGAEAERILRNGRESKDQAVRWFLLLLSTAIGCMVIACFPFGWFSVGILAFSLALGFAGYYFYLKKKKETL